MKEVKIVITDLDDTIWDWLKMWHSSFNPFLERIVRETGLDSALLKEGFRDLHRKYGTTEMSFAYKELPVISSGLHYLFETEESDGARNILHEYYSNKKNNLRAYDGVLETLKTIKSKGTKVVAFTESFIFFTKYRIKHLSLDGLIDYIYSPEGFDLPASVYKHYSEDFWEPQITKIRSLPNTVRKPDAGILQQILKDFDVDKESAIYIGDKLDRDIYMAQQAGITSVHANYGHIIDNDAYALLREVTHWTDEDVKREIAFKNEKKDIKKPDYTIEKFSEILTLFDFKPLAQND